MTDIEKLKEMLDRGWAITITRQTSINSWDVMGAISAAQLAQKTGCFCCMGHCNSLIDALNKIEPDLARLEIEYRSSLLKDRGLPGDVQQKHLRIIRDMAMIAL